MKILLSILGVGIVLLVVAERAGREDRQASQVRIAAAAEERVVRQHEEKLQQAVRNKEPFEGMSVAEVERAFGKLSFVAEAAGDDRAVQAYYTNDGSLTRRFYFVNGQLARWTKTSNY